MEQLDDSKIYKCPTQEGKDRVSLTSLQEYPCLEKASEIHKHMLILVGEVEK